MRPRKVSGLRQDSGRLLVTGAHQRTSEQTKLLAAVGLDLFRSGLRVDGAGTKASHVEPRHPAISPNLDTIPEGERIEPSHLQQAQAIVVLGGPLGRANLPGPWLSQRIETALPLYHSIVQQEGSTCYVVPFGGDGSEEGALECEVARNHLVQRGVSPHHVLLDCNAANTIENILTLLPLLTHLRVGIVRVITSSFHMPRMQLYFDSLLHRCRAASFEIYYHPTHRDHLTLLQQRDLEAKEMALMTSTRRQLDEAMQCVHAQTAPVQQYLTFLHQATRPPPSAATYDERTKAPPTSFYGYSHR